MDIKTSAWCHEYRDSLTILDSDRTEELPVILICFTMFPADTKLFSQISMVPCIPFQLPRQLILLSVLKLVTLAIYL